MPTRLPMPLGASLVLLFAACSAHGDLYTDGVLTLDWLVDSADEIHHVRCVPSESDGGVVSEPLETLKPKSGKSALKREEVARLRPPMGPERSGEWLFFVHLSKQSQAALSRGISLDHPMASYRTAAFTRDGKHLRDRDAIFKTTKARIALERKLPPRCDRRGVEVMIEQAPSGGRRIFPADAYPFGDPAPLEQYLGGMLVRISCGDWDDPDNGPYDADTWLNVAVVPVEPDDHEQLIKAARLGEEYKGTPRYCHPLPCLVNFPGKRTEEFLHEVRQDPKARRNFDSLMAAYLLWYFHYRLEVADALNKQLVGSWRLEGQHERIDIELQKDNTFTALAGDWPNPSYNSVFTRENPRRTGYSKGYWVVRDGELSIFRSRHRTRKELNWEKNERQIFADKPILKVTETAVVLKDGPPMKRRPPAPPPYAKSPSPEHIQIRRDLADCSRLNGTQRLVFLSYEEVAGGESYAAEFRNADHQKITLLFAGYEYLTDAAKEQNVQPILFHDHGVWKKYHDTWKKKDYVYEIVRRSNEEQRILAMVKRASVDPAGQKRDGMEPRERLKWIEARLRDRQPVVKQPERQVTRQLKENNDL